MIAKFSGQEAAIRPQNIGLEATVAKRPHFAHGWSKATTTYQILAKDQ